MDPIHALQAEVCRVLSHPIRIGLLHELAAGPLPVTVLATRVGITQPNASQHLAVMRAVGLVETQRDGREVLYELADPDVIAACDLMAGVMRRRLSRIAELSARIGGATRVAAAPAHHP